MNFESVHICHQEVEDETVRHAGLDVQKKSCCSSVGPYAEFVCGQKPTQCPSYSVIVVEDRYPT